MQYKIEYRNEYKFETIKNMLKKINFQAYKKLIFSALPSIKEGNFPGKIIKKYNGQTKYELLLPTETYFGKIHGKIKLIYTVYPNKKITMIEKLEPEDYFEDISKSPHINMYNGIPLSSSIEKDMFKINLLNLNGAGSEKLPINLERKIQVIKNYPKNYDMDINKIKYYSNYIDYDILFDIDTANTEEELLSALYEYRGINRKISLLLDKTISKIESTQMKIESIDVPPKIKIIHEMLEEVKNRPTLYGYHLNKAGYVEFTDSYRFYILNMAKDLKKYNFIKLKETPLNYRKYIDKYLREENYREYLLNIADIYDFYEKNKYNVEKTIYPLQIGCRIVNIDIKFLMDTIKLLGEDISCYISEETKPIYFQNEFMEEAIVLPVRTY